MNRSKSLRPKIHLLSSRMDHLLTPGTLNSVPAVTEHFGTVHDAMNVDQHKPAGSLLVLARKGHKPFILPEAWKQDA